MQQFVAQDNVWTGSSPKVHVQAKHSKNLSRKESENEKKGESLAKKGNYGVKNSDSRLNEIPVSPPTFRYILSATSPLWNFTLSERNGTWEYIEFMESVLEQVK